MAMHSVAHHCLDVAAAAVALLPIYPPPVAVPAASVIALIALHDVGKFSRTFQAKVPALWPASLGPLPRLRARDRNALAWWFAGFTVVADWVGSAQHWFPSVVATRHTDLGAYWQRAYNSREEIGRPHVIAPVIICVPRACGDEPVEKPSGPPGAMCSPRVRGIFL